MNGIEGGVGAPLAAPDMQHRVEHKATQMMKQKDADGDGALSQEELGAPREIFDHLDINGDGSFDLDEAIGNYAAYPEIKPMLNKHIANFINAKDSDGDGVLTEEELGKEAGVFESTDTNGDGVVDIVELTEAFMANKGPKEHPPAGEDDAAVLPEPPTPEPIPVPDEDLIAQGEAFITENDGDLDGLLTREEIGIDEELFNTIDTNGDGVIDLEEIINNYFPLLNTEPEEVPVEGTPEDSTPA